MTLILSSLYPTSLLLFPLVAFEVPVSKRAPNQRSNTRGSYKVLSAARSRPLGTSLPLAVCEAQRSARHIAGSPTLPQIAQANLNYQFLMLFTCSDGAAIDRCNLLLGTFGLLPSVGGKFLARLFAKIPLRSFLSRYRLFLFRMQRDSKGRVLVWVGVAAPCFLLEDF
ncbi:hypothetical protein GOBAR_DD35333 [Gossypium barbadense]|nr:hypothetical protein GOBAR_DD35333 [Gossypium barbadense]